MSKKNNELKAKFRKSLEWKNFRKHMTKNDILKTNIKNYWNNFSESEQKWLMDHIVLEQDKTLIYKDDSWKDWKDFI